MINNGERYKYFNSVAESLFNERAETCLDIRLTGGTNEGRKCSRLALGKFTIWEVSRHGIVLPRTCSHLNFVMKYQSFKDQFFVIKIKKKYNI